MIKLKGEFLLEHADVVVQFFGQSLIVDGLHRFSCGILRPFYRGLVAQIGQCREITILLCQLKGMRSCSALN